MEQDHTPVAAPPVRPMDAHKGRFGRVAVVGGRHDAEGLMLGAPALSARAALRAGAGLCSILAPEGILREVIALCPSATGQPLPVPPGAEPRGSDWVGILDRVVSTCDAMAIGPGLGRGDAAWALCLRAAQQEETPVVFDADAIHLLARTPELHHDFRAPAVLTPHPGEFRVLADALSMTLDPVQPGTRPDACTQMAQRLGCIVVLKGAGTVVSNGLRTWVCERGHPCLATAGTGDVLTGIIASIIAQQRAGGRPGRMPDLYESARLGVQLHAVAGELWAQRHGAAAGLLAQELADLVPEALAQATGPSPG